MNGDDFRAAALALPEACEGEHQGHPDFRVRTKIFATLGPGETWGMLKLPPEVQQALVRTHPDDFEPFAGAWGRGGATKVHLASADPETVRNALALAWRDRAPKKLLDAVDDEPDGPPRDV